MDDIMDLYVEDEGDDTFAGIMDEADTTKRLAEQARRNTGLMRSPSPAGSASSIEELETLKKVGIGGNYCGVEPYSAMDKAEKDEVKKLRARVAQLQQDLDIARRKPLGPPTPSYGSGSNSKPRGKALGQMTGAEKQGITCRDW